PPEIYQSPAGSLSAGLFLCPKSIEGDQLSTTTLWFWRVGRRQKSIKAPQVLYLRGFFYVQNPSKATSFWPHPPPLLTPLPHAQRRFHVEIFCFFETKRGEIASVVHPYERAQGRRVRHGS
ncbi:hypothetical protein KKF91_02980, partial [Myxococcota bacterium]|nr:hypothetical protein [Myxococcota bacterium]